MGSDERTQENVVLLTAAVAPNVSGAIAISDPAVRLREYQMSIARWISSLQGSPFQLVVVETTGESQDRLLEGIAAPESADVRVVGYMPTRDEMSRGKGAVEIAAIRHAVNEGVVRNDGTLYKCTGRLALMNAGRVLSPLGPASVKSRMAADRSWVDTRLLGASLDVWTRHLFKDAALVDDSAGRYLERVLAARLAYAASLHAIRLERFAARPRFEGKSGTTGGPYNWRATAVRDRVLRPVESMLHSLAARKQV